MHDWVISTMDIDWHKSTITISLKTPTGNKTISAFNFVEIIIPKRDSWGPSKSIYNANVPVQLENNNFLFSLEMQSGDTITIEAKKILLPD